MGFFFFIVVFIVLRQSLTIWPWQSWNSLCKPSWPQAHKDPTAFASQVLELRHVPPDWLHCYFFTLSVEKSVQTNTLGSIISASYSFCLVRCGAWVLHTKHTTLNLSCTPVPQVLSIRLNKVTVIDCPGSLHKYCFRITVCWLHSEPRLWSACCMVIVRL